MIDPRTYKARPDLLKERVILVTGATRGLGRMAALAFAGHGATVVLHGRDQMALEAVYDEIESNGHGPQPAAIPLDLLGATVRDYDALAYAIESRIGRLDGILHNASHLGKLSALEHQTIEEWNDDIASEPGGTGGPEPGLHPAAPCLGRRISDPDVGDARPCAGGVLGCVCGIEGRPRSADENPGGGMVGFTEPAHKHNYSRPGGLALPCQDPSG